MTGRLVPARGPFDVAAVLSTLVNHEIAGLTETDPLAQTLRRVVRLDGEPVELRLRFVDEGVLVDDLDPDLDPAPVERLVARWLDLDTDIAPIDRHLEDHETFRRQVRTRPGIRVTAYPDSFEATILIVLGQQISLGAARTFGSRLVSAYGRPLTTLMAFPTAERLAAEPISRLRETIGTTGARARTISEVAGLFAEQGPPRSGGEIERFRDRLLALPGIGPWTVSCLAIRAFGLPDEFPASDAVLRRALGGISGPEAETLAEEWRPYRSYSTVRLWAEAADRTSRFLT